MSEHPFQKINNIISISRILRRRYYLLEFKIVVIISPNKAHGIAAALKALRSYDVTGAKSVHLSGENI